MPRRKREAERRRGAVVVRGHASTERRTEDRGAAALPSTSRIP